jgi:hypothetical protein
LLDNIPTTRAEDQNTIIVISFSHGIDIVSNEFSTSINAINNNTFTPTLSNVAVEHYLGRLSLVPSYNRAIGIIDRYANMTEPEEDASILADQYFGQIVLLTANVSRLWQ